MFSGIGPSSDHWLELLAVFSVLLYIVLKRRGQKLLMTSLHNKAVLITGCDSGFGHELAKKLDKKGITVFAGCMFPFEKGAMQLKKLCSNTLHILHIDVTKDDHVQTALKDVRSILEANNQVLWAVVSNAGVATFGETEWTPLEIFQKMFDVNALGPVRITKAFLPLLRKSRGRLIIVTSLAGYHTFPGVSAYSMSKHATLSLADALRCELRKWNITVHTICPTLYRTNISKEDVLMKDVQSFWGQLTESLKNEYGDIFFLDYQDTLRLWLKRGQPEENISEVVCDMEEAVIGHNPKSRYVPGLSAKLQHWLLSILPLPVLDYALCYGMPHAPLERGYYKGEI